MRDGNLLIIKGPEVAALLDGRELELIQLVRQAYEAHAAGASSLPQSCFLRFPDEPRNRIIALPAYLGQEVAAAGLKWVSSFPGNLRRGLDRASAIILLNSAETGRVKAVIEGSLISGRRTAASAALSAQVLHAGQDFSRVGLIGCGFINFEVLRFLRALAPEIDTVVLYDLDIARALQFKEKCRHTFEHIEVQVAGAAERVLSQCALTAIATTAVKPHLADLTACPPGGTILHISLRDFTPEVILASDNVVDDVEHVCREQTSVHLAEQLTGSRAFIRCTLADLLRGQASPKRDSKRTTIFSPFGLGVLDLALSSFVYARAIAQGYGTTIEGFLPDSWVARA